MRGWDVEPAADLAREHVCNLAMTRHRGASPAESLPASLVGALVERHAAVGTQVALEVAALHRAAVFAVVAYANIRGVCFMVDEEPRELRDTKMLPVCMT
jgi:hypothetical protein